MPTIATTTARAEVRAHIAAASHETGVDFRYLVGQAQIESALNPRARAATSSATGLYQFIEQTWLATVDQHGDAHGLGWAAERIARGADGRYRVTDPAARQAILALRDDPRAASLMAGEFAGDNARVVEAATGRSATPTDLYLAHFLGSAGAARFLTAAAGQPGAVAAGLFPQAAASNPGVFYAGGRALTLGEVYGRLNDKMARGMALGDEGGDRGGGFMPGTAPRPVNARTEWQLAARAVERRQLPPRVASANRDTGELARMLLQAMGA